MTGPEVLVSGGEGGREPRRLPLWLRRTTGTVVVLGLVVAGLVRLSADQQRQDRLERVADAVDVRSAVSADVGLGVGGTVVLGVQVTGTGARVRVGAPVLVPPYVAELSAVGAPLDVSAGRGSPIKLRLRPDCTKVLALPKVQLDLPMTPASGRLHVVRIAFARGPDMLRRACGYLPPDDALARALTDPRVDGERLLATLHLRNDGRRSMTVWGLRSPGLTVLARPDRVTVPAGAAVAVLVELRVAACDDAGPLHLLANQEADPGGELLLAFEGGPGAALGALRARQCR